MTPLPSTKDLAEQISTAIIFREKILVVLNRDPIPFIYYPYYLLSLDDEINYKVKGYRAEPKSILNFNLSSVLECITLPEEFELESFTEPYSTMEEISEGYVLYMNINT